jgi:hypothetical protein
MQWTRAEGRQEGKTHDDELPHLPSGNAGRAGEEDLGDACGPQEVEVVDGRRREREGRVFCEEEMPMVARGNECEPEVRSPRGMGAETERQEAS